MFKIGDYVIQNNENIMQIISKDIKNFGFGEQEYFVLKVFSPQETVSDSTGFVPVNKSESFLAKLLTKEEALEEINFIKQLKPLLFTDFKLRKIQFNNLSAKKDRHSKYLLLKSLLAEEKQLIDTKKNLNFSELSLLEGLSKTIFGEFNIVLGLDNDSLRNLFEN